MKRVIIIGAAVAAVILIVALLATSLERVPDKHVAVRIGGDGAAQTYGPGLHFVPPLAEAFAVYPVGAIERRFPLTGVYEALTSYGVEADVALDLRFDIGGESAGTIYDFFGGDLFGTVEEMLEDVVEIEMAKWPGTSGTSDPKEFAAAVAAEITPKLNEAGIRLAGYRFAAWDIGIGEDAATSFPVTPVPLRKIVFVGVDGGDWEIIDPWIAKGYLPNFKTIVERGTTGRLQSMEPLLSPLIWTSIATGKLPEHHGILNFTVTDPQTGKKVPITRMYRKVDAFWNILGDYGRTVDVVGWLASYPAEEINGVMVTDRVGYLAYADAGSEESLKPGSVSPDDKKGEISRLVVRSGDVDFDEFERLLHIDRRTFEENKSLPFDPENPVNNMIMLYASALTYRNIAIHLLSNDRPDVLGVYFELADAAGHLFMNFAPPRQPWVNEDEYDKYKDAMLETYRLQDRILGEFIEMCDENTILVVASDHGFKSGQSRPKLGGEIGGGHAAFWHQLNGIIGFYGVGIRRGHKLDHASIMDITPTLLALQGLPQPADMPGEILTGAFEDSLAKRFNTTVVSTLQRRRDRGTVPESVDQAASEEALKKLEALGYITPENPDAHNNLGQRYQERGEFELAVEEFKKALAINPNFPSALNNIGVCYGRLKKYSRAEESFKKALAIKPDDVYAMNNLAILYMENREFEKAIEYGEMAIRVEPNYANGHLTLGSIYANMGRLDSAEREFARVLELEPENKQAQSNLQKLRSARSAQGP